MHDRHHPGADAGLSRALRWIAIGVATAAAGCLAAPDPPPPRRGSVHLSVDNDSLAGSDGEYSSGVQLGWISAELRSFADAPLLPAAVGRGLDGTWPLRGDERQRLLACSLSHRIFTPFDLTLEDPAGRDMPYSASLYAATTAVAQDARRMDALTLVLGVVGPLAQGEEVQDAVHDWINSDEANGWEEQVPNEPLVNVGVERRWALARGAPRGWSGDWLAGVHASAGNLATAAGAGTALRWGWNVPRDFAVPPPFFGDEAVGARPVDAAPPWSAYGFVHVDGAAVAHAIQWDGAVFRESPGIDYDPLVGRAVTGIAVQRGRLNLSLSFAAMTVPWDHPEDRGLQWYGRIGVGWSY